ncbi:MAG: hypothetical protein COV66_03720 [Nitrospinae bacterium CG11_big_fil_rev_8_21_14_0_20_45_15]|nr:MAG: hypothetical protein COV66_03720 [Nitrospinae bacterium CG11_big_fil_rev_8_21_14_0_20_45_15]
MKQTEDDSGKKSRLEHLEETCKSQFFALDLAASLGAFHGDSNENRNPELILEKTFQFLVKILPFEMAGFYIVREEDYDFILKYAFPENKHLELDDEVQKSIDSGKFAWALNQNQAVVSKSSLNDRSLVLHVLATQTRIIGMFTGLLTTKDLPSFKQKLKLISIVIQYAANSLESAELFNLLKESRDNLQIEVDLKTAELIEQRNKAQQANQEKSNFLAKMSHELRTPMNAILGFSQLLTMDINNTLTEIQKKNIGMISTAGEHLLKLINQVLDLSKVESGKLDLTIQTIDINPLLENVLSISKSLLKTNNISLEYHRVSNDRCFINADPLRMNQILLNLISNAIKYNKPNGSVILSVENLENGRIRFGIRDTGHGIPDNKKDKIFQPFERFDVDAEKIEGTGIGLTITKQLVALMGGQIDFESVYEQGSFFYIDFPAVDSIQAPFEVKATPHSNELPISSSNDEVKILYIEDISVNVELVKQLLEELPRIKLLSASNALDGIELAKNELPNLILMDINMPGMNGLTAFQKLQEIKETAQIPVIALSANAMNDDIQEALDMGFKDYLTKPINVPKFLGTINSFLT